MSTLTLGIVVILYMFVIAWLGYIGYKQTKNASDYLLGGRKVLWSYIYFCIGYRRFRWCRSYFRYGYPVAMSAEYVYGSGCSLYLLR